MRISFQKGKVGSGYLNKTYSVFVLTELSLHNHIFTKINGTTIHLVSNARKSRVSLYSSIFFTSQIPLIIESY